MNDTDFPTARQMRAVVDFTENQFSNNKIAALDALLKACKEQIQACAVKTECHCYINCGSVLENFSLPSRVARQVASETIAFLGKKDYSTCIVAETPEKPGLFILISW